MSKKELPTRQDFIRTEGERKCHDLMATKSPRRPDSDLIAFREPNGDQNGLLSRLVTKIWLATKIEATRPDGDLIRLSMLLKELFHCQDILNGWNDKSNQLL